MDWLYASQSTGWFKQQVQRFIDGGKSRALPDEKRYRYRQAGLLDAAGKTWWIAT